jgi:hypothetical protein
MANELTIGGIERALITGDLSKLSENERLQYYSKICESLGVNPMTKPFAYLQLSGKLTLYATRDCTDQLRKNHGVSIEISGRETFDGIHVVTARATDKHGRYDESTGAVTMGALKGDALANALMKAETKAKRRVTLSICGLGMLDETEIETIKDAHPGPEPITVVLEQIDPPKAENPPTSKKPKLTPREWVDQCKVEIETIDFVDGIDLWETENKRNLDALAGQSPELRQEVGNALAEQWQKLSGIGKAA